MLIPLDQFPTFTAQESWGIVFALVFIFADVVVGTVCAFGTGSWNSTKMRQGIFHKVLEVLILALAVITQPAVALVSGLQLPGVIVLPVCCALILMEIGSCLENIGEANPDLQASGIFKIFSNKSYDSSKEPTSKE